jgi:hypothetical protein
MSEASSVKHSTFHESIAGRRLINLGRMSAGEHKHNIVATADKTPKRGSTGAGDKFAAACNGIAAKRKQE